MTQSLAQLQAEWHESENDPDGPTGAVFGQCADALQPHVEREAAAQAKSLADERRIADLTDQLSAERTRRLKAEEVVDRLLKQKFAVVDPLTNWLNALRNDASEYRTQYPRVGEEK